MPKVPTRTVRIAPLALAALVLAACQPPPTAHQTAGSEPTKVTPEPDAHQAAGEAVPRAEAQPGETPPPAKGGY